MPKGYRIAFLTSIDPTNKLKLSGSPYYIMRALSRYVGEVTPIGPVTLGHFFLPYLIRFFKKLPRPYNLNHSYVFAYFYARAFEKKLKGKNYDFIFAPRSSTEIALLKTDIPILYYSDTTFHSMYNYYSWFSHFCRLSEIEGNNIERLAIKNSAVSVFASKWAADSAINYYQTPKNKIRVVPFGPNVDIIPSREKLDHPKSREICKLLFIGVEWERKGGQIAFETLLELKRNHIKTQLTVLGVKPPDDIYNEDLIVIPFLNKNINAESDQFNQLLLENHFLILPTREECFGVVFCEASAYGLPSLATDTGGIPTAVVNGKNGFRFAPDARGHEYAQKIIEYFTDYDSKYIPLSQSARQYYEDTLNWESFGTTIKSIANDFLNQNSE